MYDPKNMPKSILTCHQKIDEVFEKAYNNNGLNSDDERIEALFKLYEKINDSDNLI